MKLKAWIKCFLAVLLLGIVIGVLLEVNHKTLFMTTGVIFLCALVLVVLMGICMAIGNQQRARLFPSKKAPRKSHHW